VAPLRLCDPWEGVVHEMAATGVVPDGGYNLAGGVFVVDAAKSEPLTIPFSGQSDNSHALTIRVTIAENGAENAVEFGSVDRPICMAGLSSGSADILRPELRFKSVGSCSVTSRPPFGSYELATVGVRPLGVANPDSRT
jgi:hypothetical protein